MIDYFLTYAIAYRHYFDGAGHNDPTPFTV